MNKIFSLKNNYSIIFLIFIISIFLDYFFFINSNLPAWDQGYHISNVFKMNNILSNENYNSLLKFDKILDVTDSYRGPFTYFLSSLIIKTFNTNSYTLIYLSNHLFNFISIFSIYNLGKIISNKPTGIWASIIFAFSPFIIIQRTDYLLDLSGTSFFLLTSLFLTKWFLKNEHININSIFSGISLGFLFLIKPTNIILLFIPISYLIINKLLKSERKQLVILEIILFILLFSIIIEPWFSRNWLTIITSILNAWKWGYLYQEDLDVNTIGGWLYYFLELPNIIGKSNLIIILSLIIYNYLIPKLDFKSLKIGNKINKWFISLFINSYLVLSIMSTKDPRFFLPIYPILIIYLVKLIRIEKIHTRKFNHKKLLILISIGLTIAINIDSKTSQVNMKNSINNWPHKDLIKEITNRNPFLVSTLAIIPDTKEVNTFNLEAEAARQGENVAVRQIISNKGNYKDDLKYFDWFLVKTGEQGIMTNESKLLLQDYLLRSDSFKTYNKWKLPDKSYLLLIGRSEISSTMREIKCQKDSPNLSIYKISNGISLKLDGKGSLINSSNLILDLFDNNNKKILQTGISLGNGIFTNHIKNQSCYSINQNIPLSFENLDFKDEFYFNSKLINSDLENIYAKKTKLIVEKVNNNNYILFENKISTVNDLGKFLRNGEFDNLFKIVGILNQSDPQQNYLKNAELINKYKYKENKKVEYLYNILISQILNQEIKEANKTIDKILKEDYRNGNTYLIKSIINIYLFNKNEAKIALLKANSLNISIEGREIKKYIEGLIKLMEFNIIDSYKIISST